MACKTKKTVYVKLKGVDKLLRLEYASEYEEANGPIIQHCLQVYNKTCAEGEATNVFIVEK